MHSSSLAFTAGEPRQESVSSCALHPNIISVTAHGSGTVSEGILYQGGQVQVAIKATDERGQLNTKALKGKAHANHKVANGEGIRAVRPLLCEGEEGAGDRAMCGERAKNEGARGVAGSSQDDGHAQPREARGRGPRRGEGGEGTRGPALGASREGEPHRGEGGIKAATPTNGRRERREHGADHLPVR